MAVEITSTTTLRPSPPFPCSGKKVPLTIFDKAAFDLHVAVLYAFKAPMPSNDAMKEGLTRVLHHFPHLAGRLTVDDRNRQCIHLNGAGIRLIETRVDTTLEERLPLDPSEELRSLRPPIENVEELLQIQLNRFACGGLVIGQTAHHRVADGQSMSAFFLAWARSVRGSDIDPLPFHDRTAVTVPRNPPYCEFNHREIEFQVGVSSTAPVVSLPSIANLVVYFSPAFITQMKKTMAEEHPGLRISTFECLLTHLWKKVSAARGLSDDETTQVRVAVNGRSRMKPSVPMEYFGNLVLWAYPQLKANDLQKNSYVSVARTIHEAVARVDERYFESFVDFGEILRADGGEELAAAAAEIGNSLSPNLEVDSWLRFQFHDLDFGGGPPCEFLPPNLPVEGLLIMVPSCKEKGGVNVYMSLSPDCVHRFRQISHSLD